MNTEFGHRQLPLFALNTWLYPSIPLRLQVFEPRYLSMISRQLKRSEGFGIIAITEGREVGSAAKIAEYGVVVSTTDWRQQDNGLLGITVQGQFAFRVLKHWVQDDQLIVAEVDYLPEELPVAIDDQFSGLQELLDQLKQHPNVAGLGLPPATTRSELGWQLAYLLPLEPAQKSLLLETSDSLWRLRYLADHIGRLAQA